MYNIKEILIIIFNMNISNNIKLRSWCLSKDIICDNISYIPNNTELNERIEEFEVVIEDKIDEINLNKLYDYYYIPYNLKIIKDLIKNSLNNIRFANHNFKNGRFIVLEDINYLFK